MTHPRHRPKVLPDLVRIETTVPAEMSTTIDSLAAAVGVSRYSFIRSLLAAGLQPFTATNPGLARVLASTTYTLQPDRKTTK